MTRRSDLVQCATVLAGISVDGLEAEKDVRCNECVKLQGREGEGASPARGPLLRGSRGAECARRRRLLRLDGLAAGAQVPYRSAER